MRTKKILSVVLSMALCASMFNYTVGTSNLVTFDNLIPVQASQDDEQETVVLSNIPESKLDSIAEVAMEDGEVAAETVNAFTEEVDYEAALNAAFTAYYETEDFSQLEEFEENLDERAKKIAKGYKDAKVERDLGYENGFVPGEVVAIFDKEATMEEIENICKAEYGEVKDVFKDSTGDYVVTVSISLGQTVDMASSEYAEYAYAEAVDSNDLVESEVTASQVVNDPYVNSQWYLDLIKAPDAWEYLATKQHGKVKIAVIDSGVNLNDTDFAHCISSDSIESNGGVIKPLSQCATTAAGSHATAITSIIASKSNDGKAMAGIASGYSNDFVEVVECFVAYVDSSDGRTYMRTNDIYKSLTYCIEKGVKIANCSFGALRSYNSTEYNQYKKAADAGLIVVCSSGNDYSNQSHYPSDYDCNISVAGCNSSLGLYYTGTNGTNYGTRPDIVAPGQSIYVKNLNGTYGYGNGTSYSSPMVVAVMAMMMSINPTITKEEMLNIMQSTATPLKSGTDKLSKGVINAGACVRAAGGDSTANLLEVIGANVTCTGNNRIAVVWGQDQERMAAGYKYNVYVNGELKLNNVLCNMYEINDVTAGNATVKITAVLNGMESKGVEFSVNVSGNVITTIPETTTLAIYEPSYVSAFSVNNNEIIVSWNGTQQMFEAGYKYNVYINGELKLKDEGNGAYTFKNMPAGTYSVRVSSVYNGKESAGVYKLVTVKGEQATTVPVTTTVSKHYITAGGNWNETSYWSLYMASGWGNNPTGSYCPGNTYDDFSLKLATAAGENWAVQLKTQPIGTIAGNTYTCKVKIDSNMSTSNNLLFKEDRTGTEKSFGLNAGSNEVTLTFVAGETAQLFFDLGKAPAGLTFTITAFELPHNVQETTVPVTTIPQTTVPATTMPQTTVAVTTTTQRETTIPPSIYNVAKGKKVVTSSNENTDYVGDKAFDGDLSTRWSSAWNDGEWIMVDLGQECTVNYITIDWEAAYASNYTVSWSLDGNTWYNASTRSITSSAQTTEYFTGRTVRYIKLTANKRATTYGTSIYEMTVMGYPKVTQEQTTEVPTTTVKTTEPSIDPYANIAKGKKVVTSSNENSDYVGDKAVDGDASTRWSSTWNDGEWIMVDLGSVYALNSIRIDWEAAYASSYTISLSEDGVTWVDAVNYNATAASSQVHQLFTKRGRYVKIICKTRGTTYGSSIFEIDIKGSTV